MIGRKQLYPLIAGILALTFTVILLIPIGPLPPLRNFIDPQHGLWGMAEYAELPSEQTVLTDIVSDTITVFRDKWGIPHIYAHSEWDMYFAMGYCHGQDRLWQMDIIRRQYSGTVSEVLGAIALDSDIYWRTLGLMRSARETWDWYKTNEQNKPWTQALEAYAEGVNYYVKNMKKEETPYEFLLMDYEPRSPFWEPADTIGFGKYMQHELAHDGFRDLKLILIRDALGSEKTAQLFPINNTHGMIPVLPNYGECEPPSRGSNKKHPTEMLSPMILKEFWNILDWDEKLQETSKSLPHFSSGIKQFFGSNNWVVNGTKSATGLPILANDMHLPFSIPPIWYQAQLVNLNSDYNDVGFCFPGNPFIIAGHTNYIARGYTNVGADVVDYYYYTISPNGNAYWNDSSNSWNNFITVPERIKVKGENDFILKVNYTAHGPVLNEVREEMVHGVKQYTTPVAMRWTALDPPPDTLMRAIYNMGHARNLTEFQEAQKDWGCPGQNTIFASTGGDIAIRPVANYPIRPKGYWGRIPYNGSAGEGEWLEYIPYNELPVSENPSQGFLSSTNQKTTGDDYPYYLGWSFDPGYRSRRINELIVGKSEISFEDMQDFQQDVLDTAARAFVPHILKRLGTPSDSQIAKAVNYLEDWDYMMDKDEVAPLLYAKFIQIFVNETFTDEWRENNLPNLLPPLNNFEFLMLQNTSHSWFDDVTTTSKKETVDDIILRSISNTISLFSDMYGDDMSKWTYGRYHKASFEHPAGLSALSYDPIPFDGSWTTVSPASDRHYRWDETEPFIAVGGASERWVVDLGNITHSESVIPGGQRGWAISKHYFDQLKLFIEGKYHPDWFYATPGDFPPDLIESTLILKKKVS